MTFGSQGTAHLSPRFSGDGSFSLYSVEYGEGFHCRSGALLEAQRTFVRPAQLERFCAGEELWVVDVCVGLGTNSAALLEAAAPRGLRLRWFGLEIDPAPLALALAEPSFCAQWQAPLGLDLLRQLRDTSCWRSSHGQGQLHWGDARRAIEAVLECAAGRCDLVMLDAFSPRHCPQLWSQEFLAALAALLAPGGVCSPTARPPHPAAAWRRRACRWRRWDPRAPLQARPGARGPWRLRLWKPPRAGGGPLGDGAGASGQQGRRALPRPGRTGRWGDDSGQPSAGPGPE